MRDSAQDLDLNLRPAAESDRAFARELHHACYRPWVEPIFGWDLERQDRFFAESWAPQERSMVELRGKAIGSFSVSDRGSYILIADIEVHPDHQGRGVGTALLRRMLADADARCLPVRLQVLKGNPARRLYSRLGFVDVAQTDTHHIMVRAHRPVERRG